MTPETRLLAAAVLMAQFDGMGFPQAAQMAVASLACLERALAVNPVGEMATTTGDEP